MIDMSRNAVMSLDGLGRFLPLLKKMGYNCVMLYTEDTYEVMLWSDMFFRSWNDGKYFIPKTDIPREITEAIPSSAIPVYWDYYQIEERSYSDMIENHKQLSDKLWYAGGAECSHFSQLPSLFYLAEYARGNRDEAKIKARFEKFAGIGFDVQDRRLGGLIHRTRACRRRLSAYANGEIDRIEELECELLPYRKKEESINLNKAFLYTSVNSISSDSIPV